MMRMYRVYNKKYGKMDIDGETTKTDDDTSEMASQQHIVTRVDRSPSKTSAATISQPTTRFALTTVQCLPLYFPIIRLHESHACPRVGLSREAASIHALPPTARSFVRIA